MIPGLRYWILIWYGFLLVGLLGMAWSIHDNIQVRWRHLDELFRALGTAAVSTGMLLLLYGLAIRLGQVLLVAALGLFVAAFVYGRKQRGPPPAAPAP